MLIQYIEFVRDSRRETKRSVVFILVLAGLVFLISILTADAREIDFGKNKVTVPLSFGVETIFRFPTEVRTITEANRFEIRPIDPENPDYSVLMVKPRMSEGVSPVTFLLADGTVVRLILSITKDTRLDTIVDFRQIEELTQTQLNDPSSQKRERSELELMKAMIRGDSVTDFKMRPYHQAITLQSKNLIAELVRVYEGQNFNGYVYKLKADSNKQFKVDISALEIGRPNQAIASFIERDLIGGKTEEERETFLYVVSRPGASKRKHVLPTEINAPKKAEAKS